jgi:hypothetical protein
LARHELETDDAVRKRLAGETYSSDRPVMVWNLILWSLFSGNHEKLLHCVSL